MKQAVLHTHLCTFTMAYIALIIPISHHWPHQASVFVCKYVFYASYYYTNRNCDFKTMWTHQDVAKTRWLTTCPIVRKIRCRRKRFSHHTRFWKQCRSVCNKTVHSVRVLTSTIETKEIKKMTIKIFFEKSTILKQIKTNIHTHTHSKTTLRLLNKSCKGWLLRAHLYSQDSIEDKSAKFTMGYFSFIFCICVCNAIYCFAPQRFHQKPNEPLMETHWERKK